MIWPLELGNAILVAERRKKLGADEVTKFLEWLEVAGIEIDRDIGSPARAVRLAQSQVLSVYDATYVELALRRDLPLATRDSAIEAAARALGIPLYSN